MDNKRVMLYREYAVMELAWIAELALSSGSKLVLLQPHHLETPNNLADILNILGRSPENLPASIEPPLIPTKSHPEQDILVPYSRGPDTVQTYKYTSSSGEEVSILVALKPYDLIAQAGASSAMMTMPAAPPAGEVDEAVVIYPMYAEHLTKEQIYTQVYALKMFNALSRPRMHMVIYIMTPLSFSMSSVLSSYHSYDIHDDPTPHIMKYTFNVKPQIAIRYPPLALLDALASRSKPSDSFSRPPYSVYYNRVERSVSRLSDYVMPPNARSVVELILDILGGDITAIPSLMFAGPVGAGKRTLAHVVGSTLGVKVYEVDINRFMSKYVGETEEKLAKTLATLETYAPIIVYVRGLDRLLTYLDPVKIGGGDMGNIAKNMVEIIRSMVTSDRRRAIYIFALEDIPDPDFIHARVKEFLTDPIFGLFRIPVAPPIDDDSRRRLVGSIFSSLGVSLSDKTLDFLADKTRVFMPTHLRVLAKLIAATCGSNPSTSCVNNVLETMSPNLENVPEAISRSAWLVAETGGKPSLIGETSNLGKRYAELVAEYQRQRRTKISAVSG